jgi:ribosomal protein S18 acetylase RimI-like enzyme
MGTPAVAMVGSDDAALFQIYTAVRAEELGMGEWDPELRNQVLRLQFEAQRRGYRDRFPAADERLILRKGSPIGWVIVDRSGRELHGIDIALLAEERSRGIGTSVIRALQEEAAAASRPMMITVQRLNVRALGLYVRLGFQVIRETDLHMVMEWRR